MKLILFAIESIVSGTADLFVYKKVSLA